MKIQYFSYALIWAILCSGIVLTAQNTQMQADAGKTFATPNTDQPVFMKDVQREAEAFIEKNNAGYKQYKRMEQYMLSRLGDNGEVVNATAKNVKAYNDYVSKINSSRVAVFAHNGSWDFIGPVDVEFTSLTYGLGRVNRFTFHPTDPYLE